MKLTVIGSAPAYTSQPCRSSSCYLVEHEGTQIVLDFGQGSFSELRRYRDPSTVSAVAISHLHADHCVDLIPLRHFVRFERGGHGPLLYAPAQLRSRFEAFQATGNFFGDLDGGALDAGTFRVGDLNIEAARVAHIPDSFAFRVVPADDDGPGLVYSGDCGIADDLLPLIRPGDVLLSEAAFGTERDTPGIHLTAAEAASVADRGSAARLILTHVLDRNDRPPMLEAARSGFSGGIEFAEPGMTVDIR